MKRLDKKLIAVLTIKLHVVDLYKKWFLKDNGQNAVDNESSLQNKNRCKK